MINKSISYRLSIFISLAVIGVFVAFISTTFFFNRQLLKQNIENHAIGLSSRVSAVVNQNIVTTKEVAKNLSDQILYYSRNNDEQVLLSQVMNKYEFLNAIHINIDSTLPFDNHNSFIVRQADTLHFESGNAKIYDCISEEEIITQLINTNKSGWSKPFRCDQNGEVVVSYYYPITNGAKKLGEVLCELSLLELNDAINTIQIGSTEGFAFLIDREGRYITFPEKEKILSASIPNLSDKVYNRNNINFEKIIENNKSGSAVVYPQLLDYKKAWAYYTPVNDNNWFLIFVMPYYELFNNLYLITLRLMFFSVIGIIIIYLIITYITKKLIEPLSEVTNQLITFSSQSGQHPMNTLNEIKLVSESLSFLRLWFQKYKEEQNRELIKSNLQKQDLLQASEIQQSIIKTTFPAFPERNEIDLYAIYKPARIVSGDLFDYFFIDNDRLIFTIGDVSGKGVPAAIFMSIAQTIIKSNATYAKAKNIVNKANRELCTNNQHQFFLTLFLGVLNVKNGELYFCNAAHTTILIVKQNGEIAELNNSHGLPLGLYPEKEYNDSKTIVERGDSIILYSDGVTELQDENKMQFGLERFKQTLSPLALLQPEEMVREVEKTLGNYQGKAPQFDDLTLFVIRYNQ